MEHLPMLSINNGVITREGRPLLHLSLPFSPDEAYRGIGTQYPKFFKMDALCKWAWIAAEALLKADSGMRYDGFDKSRIAVVLATSDGCIDTDKRYAGTMADIPSPAVFVYTLPNIMHGEICIRHGFGGEQLCLVQDDADEAELRFWCDDLMSRGDTDACLAGYVNVVDGAATVKMYWLENERKKINNDTSVLHEKVTIAEALAASRVAPEGRNSADAKS